MISYFVRHPVAANLLMIALCLLGAYAMMSLERETFPEFAADKISVSVAYPGASVRDVDQEICMPLEDAVTGINGMKTFECASLEGRASASAELIEGGDISQFFNDISSAVSGVSDFPLAAENPIVQIASTTDALATIAVSGIADQQGLVAYTDTLADKLLSLSGVSQATVSGVSKREIRIEFNQISLRRFGFSARDIVDAINDRSLNQPLGSAGLAEGSLILRYTGKSRTVAELEDLIVMQNETGSMVRLSDLARVFMVDVDENTASFINGEPAAIIQISKAKVDDAIRTFAAVEAVLAAERVRYPEPFKLTVIGNDTEELQSRLVLIAQNIGMGLVLVFVTMWLFFSFREAVWISATLPVSFLGGLFAMSLFGITINTVTLIALLLAVGLIMDDSIVIAENIAKRRERGASVKKAVAEGTLEVLPGVVSSFLTTACVFGPLMFITGTLGQILKVIPMVLLITLALSLLEGFLILPNHLSHGSGVARQRKAARLLDHFRDNMVIPFARKLQRFSHLTIGCSIAVLILSFGLVASGAIKFVGFASEEVDTIEARIALTSGIERDRTVSTVEQILTALNQVDAEFTPGTNDGQPLVQRVLVEYGRNADVQDNGSNSATITVDLLSADLRNVSANDVLVRWRAVTGPLPDLVQSNFTQADDGPAGSDIDIEVRGQDLAQLEAAANDLLGKLLNRDDVAEAFTDFYGGRRELRMVLTPYGYSVGLSPRNIAEQLRDTFEGAETDTFRRGQSQVAIRAKLADSVASLTELEQFPIILPGGAHVALSRVVDLTITSGYPAITRTDGMAKARIIGKINNAEQTADGISAVVMDELGPEVQRAFPGIKIGISGAAESKSESMTSMFQMLGLGLVGVYMVLAFQFRSYALPVVIMFSIPFALIGTIFGHWMLGHDLSLPSVIGFSSLAGIVVNNAILFLAFFQSHLKGDDYLSASIEAVRARFRPIVLSTMTTFVGLVPIILSTSPHVHTLVPIVIAVAFGLLASMIMVVIVFPALMAIYFEIFSVRKWIGKFEDAIS